MSTADDKPKPTTLPSGELWILATRDLSMNWRGDRCLGPAGSLHRITDPDRFRSEFAGKADLPFLILDDTTAAELLAVRDAAAEEARQEAEEARRRAEAEAEAERDRKARADALRAMVVEAARRSAEP